MSHSVNYEAIANRLLCENERLIRKLQIAYGVLNYIADIQVRNSVVEEPWQDPSMIVNNDTLMARRALKEMDAC